MRGIYEAVRDRTAQPALDGPEGAARAQLAALQTLTRLLVACEMQQRDARLVKVRCFACCSCSTCLMFAPLLLLLLLLLLPWTAGWFEPIPVLS